MIARGIWTVVMLSLAFCAFWGNALGAGHYFNPLGILFLFFAYVVFFKWAVVRDAFGSVKEESEIPILRMGYKAIQGLGAKTQRDEPPAERSSGAR